MSAGNDLLCFFRLAYSTKTHWPRRDAAGRFERSVASVKAAAQCLTSVVCILIHCRLLQSMLFWAEFWEAVPAATIAWSERSWNATAARGTVAGTGAASRSRRDREC